MINLRGDFSAKSGRILVLSRWKHGWGGPLGSIMMVPFTAHVKVTPRVKNGAFAPGWQSFMVWIAQAGGKGRPKQCERYNPKISKYLKVCTTFILFFSSQPADLAVKTHCWDPWTTLAFAGVCGPILIPGTVYVWIKRFAGRRATSESLQLLEMQLPFWDKWWHSGVGILFLVFSLFLWSFCIH